MKKILAATFLLLCSTQLAQSDTCRDKFISIVTDQTPKGPIKTDATTKLDSGVVMKNKFYQTELDHWMSEGVEPKGMPWTLSYKHAMYTSVDKGKTWKKLKALDSEKARQDAWNNLVEEAKSTKNTLCGEEEIDGVVYDWVEGEYSSHLNAKAEYRNKYWVNRQTKWVTKAIYEVTGAKYKSTVSQLIEKAPDLSLPIPE